MKLHLRKEDNYNYIIIVTDTIHLFYIISFSISIKKRITCYSAFVTKYYSTQAVESIQFVLYNKYLYSSELFTVTFYSISNRSNVNSNR